MQCANGGSAEPPQLLEQLPAQHHWQQLSPEAKWNSTAVTGAALDQPELV
jgi:hypothetical protein